MEETEKDETDKEKTDKEKIDIEALLEQGRIIQIRPHGGSMYPMFRPERDEAVIGKADIDRLRRGDVVLYRRENSILVLHRIWARRRDGFYMTGDNQTEVEGPLRPEQIKGKLLAFIRNGRRISVDNPCYVMVSRLWMAARPLRAVVRHVRRRLQGHKQGV